MQSHVATNNHDLVILITIQRVNVEVNHPGYSQISPAEILTWGSWMEKIKDCKSIDLYI